MKKIGLMGGTFDPVHNAHIALAKYAMEQYALESVIFMTSGNPPHKTDDVTDASIRLKMVELATAENDDFWVSDYEVKKMGYSYSAQTLSYLKDKYQDYEIYFIIGEDSLENINTWYEPSKIFKMATLLVYPRTSKERLENLIKEKSKEFNAKIYIIDAPVFSISSTSIREMIKEGKDVNSMIPKKVYQYIKDRGLYGY